MPASRSTGTAAMPLPSFMFEIGLCVMLVRAALRARRAEADRDALAGAVVALDGEARERLPLRPGRQPVGAEALAQLGRDEVEVEHNDLVVGAVGHADHDHGAQAEVAVR